MKNRTIVVIQGAVVVAVGLLLTQTSDAKSGQAWAAGDRPEATGVQITQNAGWCCFNGKLEQIHQRLCAAKRGRYFDNAVEAKRACGQMMPVAPIAPSPPKQPSGREGVCCLNGELRSVSLSECRERGGRFYDDREEAERDCRGERPPEGAAGVCCLNGELHPMPAPECEARRGRFFERIEEAERLCRSERPPEVGGVCCLDGELHSMPAPECEERRGRFFERIEEAERLCRRERPPVKEGVCCLDGEPHPMPERECRERGGVPFPSREEAEASCQQDQSSVSIAELKGPNWRQYLGREISVTGIFVRDRVPMLVTALAHMLVNTPIPEDHHIELTGPMTEELSAAQYGGAEMRITGEIQTIDESGNRPAVYVVLAVHSFKTLSRISTATATPLIRRLGTRCSSAGAARSSTTFFVHQCRTLDSSAWSLSWSSVSAPD